MTCPIGAREQERARRDEVLAANVSPGEIETHDHLANLGP